MDDIKQVTEEMAENGYRRVWEVPHIDSQIEIRDAYDESVEELRQMDEQVRVDTVNAHNELAETLQQDMKN